MTSELKPDLSSFGYADGGYMGKCRHCKETFIGAKRAWSCKPCAIIKYSEPKITRAVPDMPDVLAAQELVRYSVEVLSSGHPYMNSDVDGDYVFHSQAAEIIAAKDGRITDYKNLVDALHKRAEAAEAKLAQYEAQEPVAYTLIFRKSYGVNAETTFKKFEDAEKYAIRCELPLSSIIPLYASPAPCPDLKAENERLREALQDIANLYQPRTPIQMSINIARAALKVDSSNDKG